VHERPAALVRVVTPGKEERRTRTTTTVEVHAFSRVLDTLGQDVEIVVRAKRRENQRRRIRVVEAAHP
jgi:hypothetical protein